MATFTTDMLALSIDSTMQLRFSEQVVLVMCCLKSIRQAKILKMQLFCAGRACGASCTEPS